MNEILRLDDNGSPYRVNIDDPSVTPGEMENYLQRRKEENWMQDMSDYLERKRKTMPEYPFGPKQPKQMIEHDPLDPEVVWIKYGNYETSEYNKPITVPASIQNLTLLEEKDNFQILADNATLISLIEKEHPEKQNTRYLDIHRFLLDELKKKVDRINWIQFYVDYLRAKGERDEYIKEVQKESKYYLERGKSLVEDQANFIKEGILTSLCMEGSMIIWDKTNNQYAWEISYKGTGYVAGRLCGSGVVAFYYAGEVLCYLVQWVS